MGIVRQLILIKGHHRYLFYYRAGQEPSLLDAFVSMIDNSELEFDDLDAAVLSYQIGQQLERDPNVDEPNH